MRTSDLFETPERDLETLRYAEKAIGKITSYINSKNEHTPLKDCGFHNIKSGPDDLWTFPVTDAGLPHQDVYFAVGWRTTGRTNVPAYATTGSNTKGQFTLLVMLLDHDPANDTDVIYQFRWDEIVHEMTHILDYRRGLLRHKRNVIIAASKRGQFPSKPTKEQDFNSPIEFNGYYQQGLHKILAMLSSRNLIKSQAAFKRDRLRAFSHFHDYFIHEFHWEWLDTLNSVNKKRFTRRFYKLYELVRDKWPNMAAIQDIEAERQVIAARFAEQDKAAA